MTNSNIIIVGQSGQGIILASKIIVAALDRAGLRFAATEYPAITHRFAITSAHIRTGDRFLSPRIRPREGDLIIGLEPFETFRTSLLFANAGTEVITNDAFVRVNGEPNHLLKAPIAADSVEEIQQHLATRGVARVTAIPATRLAFDVVKSRAGANAILLGAAFASGRLPVSLDIIVETIFALSPRDTGARNRDGFRAGIEAYHSSKS
ncbi:2-oxoacid:acceptor oxidoreductase family protein [Rhodomicrobium lacus]|uniref:2-oxoacid:acceptor oxidoreductase family protein n=1 Tax=Rhodomicrobium lacus TaxID=2498452 RepID=UPI000F8CE6C9|nr:2-oxoacid:acceptor oxidoreductase family protein [Rhodomicrobium lacus]